jgi:hypothetical protein
MDVVQARREAGPEPARQFDFWLGEWDLTWGDGEHGTNSIYLDFDGRVIVESFDGRPSTGLQGMSISTYDEATGFWRQTWVDNAGTYLAFQGEYQDGVMDLRTKREVDGRPALMRMLWADIRHDSLTWRWQRSFDRGREWETLWQIAYTRVV